MTVNKPVINAELNGNVVSVDYIHLIEMTSLVNCVKKNNLIQIDTLKSLTAVYKDGCDGAGSQSSWNSQSMINASDHMFQYSIVPLRLEQESQVLWKNPTPNSANCTRPVYLLRASEDDEAVLNLMISATEKAREELATPRDIKDNVV